MYDLDRLFEFLRFGVSGGYWFYGRVGEEFDGREGYGIRGEYFYWWYCWVEWLFEGSVRNCKGFVFRVEVGFGIDYD